MKKILSIILSIAMVITLLPLDNYVYADGDEASNFTYTIADDEVTITGLTDQSIHNLVIPEEIEGYPVKYIAKQAFKNNLMIDTISMADTIVSIGDEAFFGCKYLMKINIPRDLERIGERSFNACSSLENFSFNDKLISVGCGSFAGCSNLTKIELPNTVQQIEESAFGGTSLEEISIPFIGWNSEAKNDYEHVFGFIFGVTWKTAKQSEYVPTEGTTLQWDKPAGSYNRYTYYEYYIPSTIRKVTITNTNNLGTNAFRECKGIEEIVVNCNIQTIGEYPFSSTDKNLKIYTIKNFLLYRYAEQNGLNVYSTKSVKINSEDLVLYKDETKDIDATVTMIDDNVDTDAEVEWTSSDESVVTVNAGKVEVKGPGIATITAEYEGKTDSIEVTVYFKLESIELSDKELDIDIGKEAQLSVTGIVPENTTDDTTVQWTSDNEEVATVDDNGKVTAISKGTATITATTPTGIYDTCTVSVLVPITEIKLDVHKLEIYRPEQYKFDVTITPDNGTDTYSFESSDESVAIVSDKGRITTLKSGRTTITVTTSRGVVDTCIVDVKCASESITISPKKETLYVDDELLLEASQYPEDSTDKVTWTSSDDSIATVDSTGLVTAISRGIATITALTENGKTDTCEINVVVYASSIELTETAKTINKGETYQIEASMKPSYAVDGLSYKSSDLDVVTVDENGLVKAVGAGDVTITISSKNGIKKYFNITVLAPAKSITINAPKTTISANDKLQLSATINPSDCTDTFEWSVDDETIATINNNGLLEAKSGGNVNVTFTSSNGVKDTISITILSTVSDFDVILENYSYIYTGSKITPNVIVMKDEVTLTLNKDYTVTYSDNINAGIGKVLVKGKNRIVGETEVEFDITTKNVKELEVKNITNKSYTGKKIEQDFKVVYGTITLKKDVDYDVEYENNINVGVASVIIKGKGNYSGKKTKTFNIVERSLNDTTIIINNSTYTGRPIIPSISIKYNDFELKINRDYTIKLSDNLNAGIATVVIKGNNNFKDSVEKQFEINPYTVKEGDCELSYTNVVYNGKSHSPEVTPIFNGAIIDSKDYTVNYYDNINAGSGKVVITFANNFTGKITKLFTIKKADFTKLNASIDNKSYAYTGNNISPLVKVVDDKHNGLSTEEYTVSYVNNKNVGDAKVIISGKKNYAGKIEIPFEIIPSVKKKDYKLVVGSKKKIKVKASGKVKFASSKKKIAKVNKKGVIVATKKGKTKVKIICNDKVVIATVKVVNPSINYKKKILDLGGTVKLKLNGQGKTTWSSNNTKVAIVENGKVKAVGSGKATIKAIRNGKTYSCKISVKKPRLSQNNLSLDIGTSIKLQLKNVVGMVKWKTDNPGVATVNSLGVVRGIDSGTAKISATYMGQTYNCRVKVSHLYGDGKPHIIAVLNKDIKDMSSVISVTVTNDGNKTLYFGKSFDGLNGFGLFYIDGSNSKFYFEANLYWEKEGSKYVSIKPGETKLIFIYLEYESFVFDNSEYCTGFIYDGIEYDILVYTNKECNYSKTKAY